MMVKSAISALSACAAVTALTLAFGISGAGAAKRDCETSPRLKPGAKEYLLSRGICHLNNGDADRAIGDLNQFIAENPNWVAGYFNRGNAYFQKHEFDLAIADYDEALRHRPNGPQDIIWNRGNAHAEKREYRQAIADYDQAIGMKPGFADFYRIRAVVHEKLGERDAAMLDYRKALSLDPKNEAARNGLDELAKPAPVPSPAPTSVFDQPRYGKFRLDWCRYWSHECGKGAADEFCQRHGFAESASFAKDAHIGKADPTTVIGGGQVCAAQSCTGFARITCRK